ncbi:alpha/beta fold hydrolase [Parasphingorhabdus sp.]|uniref:alpha/beta fold hydrolase n=1 Tax=Parasphingorhabdus sp. TaxID=2709688 RepID=UPI003A92C01F
MASKKFKGFGGITLHADVFGPEEAPTVLMLHGGGQSRNSWTATAKSLSQAGRYVIALDLRGHGESEWASDGRYDLDAFVGDLQEILRQLSSRPVIIGASLGGWIATIVLGESNTELAAGLILVDSPAKIDLDHAMLVGDELRAHANEDTGRHPFDPKFVNGLDLQEVERRVLRAAANLNQPSLLVRGADSKVSTADSIATLAALIKGSETVEIKESGHLIAVDQADTFNAVLVDFLERRSPREAPEFVAGSDPYTLRNALGCFATGVTVVTTSGIDGVNVGMTANSFTSVSLDPPLLLVCLAKNLNCLPVFQESDSFAVNVLHIGQQQVSNLFASKSGDRFSETGWEVWGLGVPIIENALANFECKKYAEYDGGDHIILVGEVVRVKFEPRRDPLLYFRGKYRRLHFT